ncbi:MAG: adenylate/guanylate cyclase domain-containing protein [Boseongicola sp.]
MNIEHGDYLLKDSPSDPWELLSPDRRNEAFTINNYMLGEGRLNGDPNITLTQLSERLLAAGLPLDRCVTIVRILHASHTASYRVWEKGLGATANVFAHNPSSTGKYESSPSALAHQSRRWVIFNPQEVPEDAFEILPELKEAGLTHYICAPIFLVNGMENVFTFATKNPAGFSAEDIALLQVTLPAIAACQEILVVHRILQEVTRMYLGEEPHKRILAGDVHRGEVTRIKSAILFADMRGFTSLTAEMTAEDATAILNEYYDCVVPAVEDNGGEVLKFIADGVLAIFRAGDDGSKACERALCASESGLKAVDERNKTSVPSFEIGIALHLGEVAYGNIGSGMRLDYTVIGRDVNLAARLAGLCGPLDQRLLVSTEFANRVNGKSFIEHGKYQLKGLAEAEAVFAPVS